MLHDFICHSLLNIIEQVHSLVVVFLFFNEFNDQTLEILDM